MERVMTEREDSTMGGGADQRPPEVVIIVDPDGTARAHLTALLERGRVYPVAVPDRAALERSLRVHAVSMVVLARGAAILQNPCGAVVELRIGQRQSCPMGDHRAAVAAGDVAQQFLGIGIAARRGVEVFVPAVGQSPAVLRGKICPGTHGHDDGNHHGRNDAVVRPDRLDPARQRLGQHVGLQLVASLRLHRCTRSKE